MSAMRGSAQGGGGEVGKLHVLAVDDSSVSRKLIEKLLRGSLYRVTVVDSGKRALELLGAGKENGSSSKGSSALRDIPVVIMSSENLPNRVSRCMEEGAEDFLLKPLRPADVPRLMSIMSGSTK
ncbi:hypothetical protein Taro_026384 [Colocasia esculenta]|uniref:Response regulatory domain-containing protein n=1 Tax=Colocasia esculenta TaxID=4460 RepID=A0A843V621_COLES|nr:hypothetical protein [Colocasia esculenta]